MVSVVIANTSTAHLLQKWEFALSHFEPDAVYVFGGDSLPESQALASATLIRDASDLPPGASLVVLAPANGANVQGTESLEAFSHPADVVYWFGSDARHLDAELFDQRQPDSLVYIPTDTIDQMYSFTAWCVVAWDRRSKAV